MWEIGLHIAGDPATPYYGNRDMMIAVGSGSGENYRPWLRMATGAPHLAHAVCRGDLEKLTAARDFSPSRCRCACWRFIRRGTASSTSSIRARG
jgi:hypothetical protein